MAGERRIKGPADDVLGPTNQRGALRVIVGNSRQGGQRNAAGGRTGAGGTKGRKRRKGRAKVI
ncbi:MAG TPA: hypothetical protein VFE09_07055, partial [Rubrobacteraceae bacterium]|nr:hypothetical protein [Rubrobacteraceae bacterium]